MNTQLDEQTEVELDLLEIFNVLLKKFWILLLAVILGAGAAVGGTILFITPQYESTTKMYVLSKQSSETLTTQDMQTSSYLTKDYAEIIKSRTVTEDVIDELNLDMKHEDLLGKMTVESATDTRILSISVRDADPYKAKEIADAIRDVSANHIKNVMAIDAVNVVEAANLPEDTVSPNIIKNGIIGGLVFGVIAALIIIVSYVANDTIKSQEDVERYLELSTLGMIPVDSSERRSKKAKKQKKRG